MTKSELSRYVKSLAAELGFETCGIARAEPIGRAAYLRAWLDSGRAGTMQYLHQHLNKRADPRRLLEGARSVVMLALSYRQPAPSLRPGGCVPVGRVAMYAWGDDYHDVVKAKLRAMTDRMRAELREPFDARACVDTAPLLERELAAAAGIGWIGKNTMVIHRRLGSFFFLGALITTLDLIPDEPVPDHCGTCRACLDACPTDAFPAPREMDASRCISYLTIEHRGDIPQALQPRIGDWIFGCDACQDVCPYNRGAPRTREPRFKVRPPGPQPELDEILAWSDDDYRRRVRGSAVKRAKLTMLKRNARIARDNHARAGRVEQRT